TIVNTANVGTFTVSKRYTNAATDPVDVTLTCDAPAVVLNNPQPASPDTSAIFDVSLITEGETTCTATEAVPAGFEVDDTDCNDGDLINSGCELVNTPLPGAAYFRVEKEFMDGNDITEASFRIDCNTGLILDQTKTTAIRPGSSGAPDTFEVEFVVTDFTQGTMTCTVSEDPVAAGYTPSYFCDSNTLAICDTGEPSDLDEYFEGPCVYNNVDTTQILDDSKPYQHLCVIRNYPDPVPVVVNKTWEFAGSETHAIDPWYKLTLNCENEIITDGAVDEGYGHWSIVFYNESDISDAQYTAWVIPDWDGGTSCEVYESQQDPAVEVENGCENLLAQLADGDECTIINTVFYEGIPTLNQYGLALLALLMLGMGMVGFRRIA
ncbi:MAG TPA: IPTL-CTERM sorting domain-containing protein, partial [Xanthomonadales bacterium]|nr:IPTL-CTERM sorting domain-containing protein [Xanthomonadales bacterium]